MSRVDFIIPSVRMRATVEQIHKEERFYCPELELLHPRHAVTYFDNRKPNSVESAHQRLHTTEGYDPKKLRCDRTRPTLYWEEIAMEENGHKVPMTTNHWYGRPNRIQLDYPERMYNRSNKMRELGTRKKYDPEFEGFRLRLKTCSAIDG